jgi:hypothetical protein
VSFVVRVARVRSWFAARLELIRRSSSAWLESESGPVVALSSRMIEQPSRPDVPRPPDPIDKPPPDIKPIPPPDIPPPAGPPDIPPPPQPERGNPPI